MLTMFNLITGCRCLYIELGPAFWQPYLMYVSPDKVKQDFHYWSFVHYTTSMRCMWAIYCVQWTQHKLGSSLLALFGLCTLYKLNEMQLVLPVCSEKKTLGSSLSTLQANWKTFGAFCSSECKDCMGSSPMTFTSSLTCIVCWQYAVKANIGVIACINW